jgi:hypothetical protein
MDNKKSSATNVLAHLCTFAMALALIVFLYPAASVSLVNETDKDEERPKRERREVGIISGLVTDHLGRPVNGALVIVKGANRFATTNADGYYVITPVPVGIFEVKASRLGYGELKKAGVKVVAGLRTNVNFTLGVEAAILEDRTKGLVEGIVVNAKGYPLKGARVRVLGNEASTETDVDGTFSVGPLAPGFYSVRADSAGYLYQTGRILVVAGEVTPVQFVLWADPRFIKFGL